MRTLRHLSAVAFLAALAAPAGAAESSFGRGGGVMVPPTDEISEAQREAIKATLAESRAKLLAEGKLRAARTKALTNFAWPLRQASGRNDPGYYGISNYVDENPLYPDLVKDFFCGARTYDTADGYNHMGTDIFTWPFGWNKMDNEDIVIAAGAPGTIIQKTGGNNDRSCSINTATSWNAVYVEHADGSVAWYGHMKNGSLTVKKVGETVVAGEYLGIVGSSGSSSGPHLHLELYDAANNLVDPWLGACNAMSQQVTWAQQEPYRVPSVTALTIGTAVPDLPECTNETSYATDYVTSGTTVYFTAYLRDHLTTTPLDIRILRPNGTVLYADSAEAIEDYDAAYWYWNYTNFPSIAGDWTFEAKIDGKTYTRTFKTNATPPYGAATAIALQPGSAQSTPKGTAFAQPLRVLVTDSLARPVKGVSVRFVAPNTGATAVVESRTALTGADGIASVTAIANDTVGSYTINANLVGVGTAPIALQNLGTGADLAVSTSVNANPATAGKDAVFTMTVSNNGPLVATSTNLSLNYDADLSPVWASPPCFRSGHLPLYVCPAGNLAVGASAQFRLVLRRDAVGSLLHSVTATSLVDDDVAGNESASLTVPVVAGPVASAVLRYRLYSDVTKEHHFTTDLNEYNVLGTLVGTWVQEGTVGKVLNNPGSFNAIVAVPYYRLYDNNTRWHHWTTDPNEYYTLGYVYSGWNMEGVDGYILPSATAGAIQLYRLNYPALGALHHWTIDANEYNTLITPAYGWVGEGGSGFVIQ